MTNTPAPLDPIAQLVAKYQSNGHQTTPAQQQSASQTQQKKGWTGFAERTLWDWLDLLGVLLVPLILGAGTILITAQQNAISQSQHESDQRIAQSQRENDQRIADNQFQESLLKTFRDDINHLVFDQHLLTAKPGDPVQVVAQSYTNDALRKLDLPRRALLVQFLSDLRLITFTPGCCFPLSLISLEGIDLQGANLQWANLSDANLPMANLQGANLRGADLSGANLSQANLSHANLQTAKLARADLLFINLQGANLELVDLIFAKVAQSDLARAYTLKNALLPDGSFYPSYSYPIPHHQEPTS